jgi:hypothetical protein
MVPISGLGPDEAVSGERGLLLVPDELYDDCPQAVVSELLRQTGCRTLHRLQYNDPQTLGVAQPEELANVLAERAPTALFMLQEAWQPPLKETEQMLLSLRQLIGQQIQIVILLIGRPTPQTILTPAEPEQVEIWSRKVRAMGDPCLTVRTLVQP